MTDAVMTSRSENSAGYALTPTLGELNAGLNPQADYWRKVTKCPACSSLNIMAFARIRHIPYDRCHTCGFTFANPIPPDEVLAAFYNSSFYDNYRKLEAAQIHFQPYFSVSCGDLRRVASWINKDKSAKILDFGCGPGSFVALLKNEFGYKNVEGLEINTAALAVAQRSYGLHLASKISELREKHYDLVILVEVIEHIPKPDDFLGIVASLVKPGGHLLITTDSVRNILARYFPSYSNHYTGPSHISLFTEKALTDLLVRFDFRIERFEVDRSNEIFGNFVASPIYALDIVSPRSDDDVVDIIFVPNKLGRMLGLPPRRSLPLLWRAIRRVDRLIARAVYRILRSPYSEHLYVLARKETP